MHDVPGITLRSTSRIAAMSTIVFALAAIVWFVLEGTPPRLGFEDTDDPAIMVGFIRQHSEVFVQAGAMLVLMAISLAIAVLAIEEVVRPRSGGVGLRSTSAFGIFSAAFFLFGGAVRIGSSGPLLHMAGLREAWGEGAYVAAQVVSQAVLIGGIFAVCLWAVGLSLIVLRTKVIPLALCALGILPAFRIVSGLLGPLDLLPDVGVLWVISIASIFGTILWCLILGIVLLRRSLGSEVGSGTR
ncbi:MAG: hypothetical protein OEV61_00490 [Chloroflexota bacterium]|nr:hypothetical protein [Chloroflexota bacterium]